MRLVARIAAMASLATVLGCATSAQLVPYSSAKPTIDYSGRCSIKVAGHDLRPQVVSGEVTPDEVGDRLGAATTKVPCTTANGKPFAQVVADVISWSMAQKGFETSVVDTSSNDSEEAVRTRAAQGVTHGIVVTIRQWWSNVHKNVTLAYDLELAVIGEGGAVLATVSRSGKDNLRSAQEEADGEDKVPAETLLKMFLEIKLTEMLNDPSVPRSMKRFDTTRGSNTGPKPMTPAESF